MTRDTMTRSRSIRAADRRGIGFGQLRRFLNECASMGDGARVTVRLYLRGTIREVTVEVDGDLQEALGASRAADLGRDPGPLGLGPTAVVPWPLRRTREPGAQK